MSALTPIDLSRLPPPAAVEALDFEAILTDMRAVLLMLLPEAAEVIDLETEPLNKLLQVFAVRELMLRARVNDAGRAVMLATATGADLDNLAALLGAQRHLIVAADPDATPPVAAVYEDDTAFRYRAQMAVRGMSMAGPRAAYIYHALSADPDVLGASVDQPVPGTVRIAVLSRSGDGTAPPALLATVSATLNADDIRPLNDTVVVVSAEIVEYGIEAELVMLAGPDAAAVRAAAIAAATTYAAGIHRIGRAVRRSALMAALHQPGVEQVILSAPAADIEVSGLQAPYCTAIDVSVRP